MDKFCKFCGTEHTATEYPKACSSCGNITFINPIGVAVLLLPVSFPLGSVGLLVAQRGIQPCKDGWALVGGFQELSDASIEHAAVRELVEETGLVIDPVDVRLISSYNNGRNMMAFCEAKTPIPMAQVLKDFVPTNEVPAIRAILEPEELCFGSHTDVVKSWFERQK
jgi:NADH pyrophosphatase NudC (nudix superfamily)